LTLGDFSLLDDKPQRPFDAYFQQWLETYARMHCKPSSVDRYSCAFHLFLLPAFGNKDIAAITRDDVKRLTYDTHLRGKHQNTIKATLTPR